MNFYYALRDCTEQSKCGEKVLKDVMAWKDDLCGSKFHLDPYALLSRSGLLIRRYSFSWQIETYLELPSWEYLSYKTAVAHLDNDAFSD
jgi:hypothetical protein